MNLKFKRRKNGRVINKRSQQRIQHHREQRSNASVSEENQKQQKQLPIKIFLFERNESDIIKYWVEHHRKITSLENITIIDHMSNDGTCNILKPFIEQGLNLVRYSGPYTNKGKMMTVEMNKHKGNSSIMIPLDADEFVVSHREGKISIDPIHIQQDLRYLISKQGIGRVFFGRIYNLVNVDVKATLEQLEYFEVKQYKQNQSFQNLPKSLFLSKFFSSTDMGNHYGSINSNSGEMVSNNLAMLHYQVRGLPHFIKKTKKSVFAFGYHTNRPVLNIGKHWKHDHDILRQRGAEKAFTDKYLKPITTDLIKFNLFENKKTEQ